MMRVYDRKTSSAILNLVSTIGLNELVIILNDAGKTIPDDAVLEFYACGELNLNELSKHQIPPYDLLMTYPKLLDWASMSKYVGQWISDNETKYFNFINNHILTSTSTATDKIDTVVAIKNMNAESLTLNLDLLIKLIQATDSTKDSDIYPVISTFDCLTSTFIRTYENKLDWYTLTSRSSVKAIAAIPEDLLITHRASCNWVNLWMYHKYSLSFINDLISQDPNENYIDWDGISLQTNITEAFITTHDDDVTWKLISEFQNLSLTFLNANKTKIVMSCFLRNAVIDKTVKQTFIDSYED